MSDTATLRLAPLSVAGLLLITAAASQPRGPAPQPSGPAPPPASPQPPPAAPPPGASTAGHVAPTAPGPPRQPAPAPAAEEPAHEPAWILTAETEGIVGVSPGWFYNHLVGARFGRTFSPGLALDLGLAYMNLKGRTGREHNLMPSVRLLYRIRPDQVVQFPVSFRSGYLPKNGASMHLCLGIGIRVSDPLVVDVRLLQPGFWYVRDYTAISLDPGIAATLEL